MTLIKSRYFLELIFLVENVFVFHGIAEAFLIPTARVSHCLVVVAWGQNLEKHLRGCRQHSSITRERVPFKFGRWGLCHAKLVWMHTENKSTKSSKSETSLIFATFCNHRGGDRIRKGYFRGSLIFGMAQQDVLRICFDVVFYMGLAQWLRSWVLLPCLLGLVSCLHDCSYGLQIPPRSAFGVSCFGPARLLVAWPWHIRPWARHGWASWADGSLTKCLGRSPVCQHKE